MDKYLGSWNFIESSNFDEYLKGLGIMLPLRKLANITKSTLTIKQDDTDLYSLTTDAGIRSVKTSFKLGEEVLERTVDLRLVKTVFKLNGDDCLVIRSTDSRGVTSEDVRCIEGNLMKVKMTVKGIESTAIFKKKDVAII